MDLDLLALIILVTLIPTAAISVSISLVKEFGVAYTARFWVKLVLAILFMTAIPWAIAHLT